MKSIIIRDNLQQLYKDVFTPEAMAALESLARFNNVIKEGMDQRMQRRAERRQSKTRISFLDASGYIPNTTLKVQEARDGNFEGSVIPQDLQQQWIQGTGPAAKPHANLESSIRNTAYALLSGADGWMFDGEDALGQTASMSLDNQRNLILAIHKDPVFLKAAEKVAVEMNDWAKDFMG
ncbi:MAG: malate synthase, partial [Bacteroidota bacterium]